VARSQFRFIKAVDWLGTTVHVLGALERSRPVSETLEIPGWAALGDRAVPAVVVVAGVRDGGAGTEVVGEVLGADVQRVQSSVAVAHRQRGRPGHGGIVGPGRGDRRRETGDAPDGGALRAGRNCRGNGPAGGYEGRVAVEDPLWPFGSNAMA